MKIKNPFEHSSKVLFALSLLWALVLLLIGAWWIYLMINVDSFINHANRPKITSMLMWEGGSFLVLLMLLSLSILILFLKDQRKTKSLQAFFASLTHELKTPLASIRLQGEVINEILASKNDPTLNTLIGRLISDTTKLETQMDKILQLSRIERGGELNLTSLSLIPLLKKISKTWAPEHLVNINTKLSNVNIEVDQFALELILKNLLENTKVHTSSKTIDIEIFESANKIHLVYKDYGEFKGDLSKLADLFYKHNSSKGSGIGLYLSQKLLSKMHGEFLFKLQDNGLVFTLIFQKSEEDHA